MHRPRQARAAGVVSKSLCPRPPRRPPGAGAGPARRRHFRCTQPVRAVRWGPGRVAGEERTRVGAA